MRQSLVLGLSLLSVFASVECGKMLVLTDTTTSTSNYLFRSNVLYLPWNAVATISINCSLPEWYNATASNTYKYEWKYGDTVLSAPNGVLDIKSGSSQASKNGVYKCSVKDSKDNNILNGWDETKLTVFRQATGYSNKRVAGVLVSVTPTEDNNHINYTSEDPHPVKHEMVLTCTCYDCRGPEATANFYWVLDGKNVTADPKRVISFNASSLSIGHPFYSDVGIYACLNEANNDTLAYVSITGVPIFGAKGGKGSDNKLEGETVSVHNELYGNPIKRFEWKRRIDDDEDGKTETINAYLSKDRKKEKVDVDASVLKRIKFYPTLDAPNGEMEITDLEKDDRATYIAEATGYGDEKATFATLVRVKGKLDALWPFLGIVAEVIILVAIIFIYERRRAKKEAALDNETPDQKKPLTSANNDNLRQRKA